MPACLCPPGTRTKKISAWALNRHAAVVSRLSHISLPRLQRAALKRPAVDPASGSAPGAEPSENIQCAKPPKQGDQAVNAHAARAPAPPLLRGEASGSAPGAEPSGTLGVRNS